MHTEIQGVADEMWSSGEGIPKSVLVQNLVVSRNATLLRMAKETFYVQGDMQITWLIYIGCSLLRSNSTQRPI